MREHKRIGILTYRSVYNFGANLQAMSTAGYLRKQGYDPIFINWIPFDLEKQYLNAVPAEQAEAHHLVQDLHLPATPVCRTDQDIADAIERYNIKGVITGSDAVMQHRPVPLKQRLYLSRNVKPPTSDRMFPNPFWGSYFPLLKEPVPLAILSASSQNAPYRLFEEEKKRGMRTHLDYFSYISVRDKWTQGLVKYVTRGAIIPPVTPDPVFAFNHNVDESLYSKQLLERFHLPEKYLLISFKKKSVPDEWMRSFRKLAEQEGYTLVGLTYPEGFADYGLDINIRIPLDPLEWYSLIKHSGGYIGHNMHPIIVSLHNGVPFFSFDNYGIVKYRFFVNKDSSKIYHILDKAGFLENRCSVLGYAPEKVSPAQVLDRIVRFDSRRCLAFAAEYYHEYQEMMTGIESALEHQHSNLLVS
ncbi:polysaccharide pyruvyl transferase family protein [Chitinophaga sp. XS-30]|uniref:polysaccharide pyruvyl transferase family protein n=1 Tax=Chitinophaga sp. XS-30 TaxID=2604421 RepID=UPI0011DDCAB2|nr:polysaccharide pyruvyl transferase family protein [Chitinophaga sp. XS-30]QEH40446.1 polysaccharide pyruvyl transferase family protein [Chitinophaga sp. XS-30]